MRAGFADLKRTLVAGFRNLPTRKSSEEMVRLLRDANRLQEDRFTHLDARIREQHLEGQQVLHAAIEGQRVLNESQRVLNEDQWLLIEGQRLLNEDQQLLNESQRLLVDGQRTLSADLLALIARIDALIRGRGDGSPPR
jgi:hypothetical protein